MRRRRRWRSGCRGGRRARRRRDRGDPHRARRHEGGRRRAGRDRSCHRVDDAPPRHDRARRHDGSCGVADDPRRLPPPPGRRGWQGRRDRLDPRPHEGRARRPLAARRPARTTRSSQRSKSARPADRISSACSSMPARNGGAARLERLLERLDVLGHLGPVARHLRRDLEVELDAVRALEAERLVRVGGRARRDGPARPGGRMCPRATAASRARAAPRRRPDRAGFSGQADGQEPDLRVRPRSRHGRRATPRGSWTPRQTPPVRLAGANGLADRTLLLREPREAPGRRSRTSARPSRRSRRTRASPGGLALVELDPCSSAPRSRRTSSKTPGGSHAMCWSTSVRIGCCRGRART